MKFKILMTAMGTNSFAATYFESKSQTIAGRLCDSFIATVTHSYTWKLRMRAGPTEQLRRTFDWDKGGNTEREKSCFKNYFV
jgi:uncharacterized membrane protein YeiB